MHGVGKEQVCREAIQNRCGTKERTGVGRGRGVTCRTGVDGGTGQGRWHQVVLVRYGLTFNDAPLRQTWGRGAGGKAGQD